MNMRGFGYRPTPKDHIRPPFAMLASRMKLGVALPDSVDLTIFTPPVFDQGSIGSCVGCAHAGAVYTTLNAQGYPLPWVPSQDDIYRLARCVERAKTTDPDVALPDLEDGGAIPAYAQLAINEWGVRAMGERASDGRFSDCEESTVNREPSLLDLERDSENLLVGQYEIFGSPAQRGLAVRQSLFGNVSVEIGGFVDSAYMNWLPSYGAYDLPNIDDPDGGGHDQYIVAYKKVGAEFWYLIQNSWGPWCMDGRVWVREPFLGQATDLNAIAVRRIS